MAAVATNPWQATARRRKAERLAFELHIAGVLAAEVPAIAREHWLRLSKALGINAPSAETVLMVSEIMSGLEAAEARMAMSSGADPFARFA